jgi:hypothetical protein
MKKGSKLVLIFSAKIKFKQEYKPSYE